MSEPGPSTSQNEASSDVDVEAATLLSQGRKFLLKGDAPSAVLCLQEACELLGTKYGELANECGESYYYYGWALLEVASMETGVLGNALDGVPESEDETPAQGEGSNIEDPNKVDEEEKEKIFHDVQNALETKEEKVKGQDDEDKSQESASEMESGKESEKEEVTAESEGEKIKVDDETTPADKEKKDAEEKADADQEEKPMDVEEEAGQKDDAKEGKAKEEAKIVEKDDAEAKKEDAEAKKEDAEATKDDTEAKKDDAEAKKDDAEAKKDDAEAKKDDAEAKKEDAEAKKEDAEAKKEKKVDTGSKTEEKDGKEAGKDEEAGPSDAEGDDNEDEGEEEEGAAAPGEDVKDEEVSNFQLSWEMLELARVIFSKQEGDEFKLKVSQVYLKLGELGLETGNFAQSVEDFTQCLTIQKQQLSDDSRLLAETHYNLALAYSFDQKFDKAIENFELSVVIIQNRITMLRKKTESDDPPSEEDLAQVEKEIKELDALIPEIKLKIADAKAEKTSAETAVRQALKSASSEFGLGSSTSTASTSGFPGSSCSGAVAKPIAIRKAADSKPDDISHLVHRKRKSEETVEEGATGKKSRQEEGAGDAAVNGSNGAPNGSNGVEQTAMNGDAKHSPDKPEIKVKQVEQVANGDSAQTAPMET